MASKKDAVDKHLVGKKHTEREMHQFVRETSSHKGYRELSVKNEKARRNLGKDEMRIAVESRLASQKRTKEQREMAEQLQALKLEKERIALGRLRDKQGSRQSMCSPAPTNMEDDDVQEEEEEGISNPYPVKVGGMSRTSSVEQLGKAYIQGRRGRRRQSHEFEDLDLNTTTGSLLPSLRSAKSRESLTALTSGRRTPSYQNMLLDCNREWAGHPDAIGSVRRARRTIEQQHRDALLSKLSSAEKFARESAVTSSSPRGPVKALPLKGSRESLTGHPPDRPSSASPGQGRRKRTTAK